MVLSKDDKKKGLDPEAETPAETAAQPTAKTEDPSIEDAEIVAEITPEGDVIATKDSDVSADEDYAEVAMEKSPDDISADIADAEAPKAAAEAEDEPYEPYPDEIPETVAHAEAPSEPEPAVASEPEPAAAPDPTPEPTPAPVVAAPTHTGGVMSTVFGGVIAAIVGFGAAQFIDVDWLGMTGLGKSPLAANTEAVEALTARVAALETTATTTVEGTMSGISAELTAKVTDMIGGLSADVSALSDRTGGLESSVAAQVAEVNTTAAKAAEELARITEGFDTLAERLERVGADLNSVEERLAEVDTRLIAVEKRPLVESSDTAKAAFDAYENQLEELRGFLAQQRADAAQLEAQLTDVSATAAAQMTAVTEQAEDQLKAIRSETEAELQAMRDAAAAQVAAAEARAAEAEANADARAKQAVAEASLSQVAAALNAGIPYEVALPSLAAVTEVPAVIAANGASGIPTVLQLQDRFTPLAREALSASIQGNMGEGASDRFMAFLRTQTGVRSLEVKEGNDPDAVLSRMTAAVEAGDLAAALAELPVLPQAGQDILANWSAGAEARVAAEAALSDLAARVNNS